jgi:cell division control protein 11
LKVQKEISDRRQELLAKEEALKSLEARLATSQTPNTLGTHEGTPAPASP